MSMIIRRTNRNKKVRNAMAIRSCHVEHEGITGGAESSFGEMGTWMSESAIHLIAQINHTCGPFEADKPIS